MIVNKDIQRKLWQFVLRTSYESDYLLKPKEWEKKIDLKNSFSSNIEKYWLELGSGWGEVAIDLAKQYPNTGFLLIERKFDRLHATEQKRKSMDLKNIRYMTTNFQWFFSELFELESFDTILINFPDPWPKRKHHKNRIMQESFLKEVHCLLKPGGEILFATDYGPYARKTISLFRKLHELYSYEEEYSFERKKFPVSYFESEKRNEGKSIYYLKRTKSLN